MKTKFTTFAILLLFWVVLSGMFDAFHLTLGVLCCLMVTYFSHDLLFYGESEYPWGKSFVGFLAYLPWLFYQIVIANVQIAYVVLHPNMYEMIDPHVVRFKTKLKRPVSKVTFAQSITLTPGTITVSIHDDEFSVYALTRSASDSLPGDMEARIARALEQNDDV
jgi:multicomponent Na+:H+ antiporter subunit E